MKEELLHTSIDIGANIIPRVLRIMLVSVRPSIGQVNLASLWSHVSEGVENVSKLLSRKILRVEVATINSL